MFEFLSREARDSRREARELQACKDIQRVLGATVQEQLVEIDSCGDVDLSRAIRDAGLSRSLETKNCSFSFNSLGGVECATHTQQVRAQNKQTSVEAF